MEEKKWSVILRWAAIVLSALGGAAGMWATHVQNEQSIDKRVDERVDERMAEIEEKRYEES